MRVLIVDDEPPARESLRLLVEAHPDLEVVGLCGDGFEAVRTIEALSPDILFLDVQMPQMDGFDVLEALGGGRAPVTVFVTAYDRYALRAFDVHAVDYLLKPYDDERFELALERAVELVRHRRIAEYGDRLSGLLAEVRGGTGEGASSGRDREQSSRLTRIPVRSRGRVYFVRVEEIDWVEAAGSYAELHARGKGHLVRESLNELETALDPARFVRINRSAIVNVDRIREMRPFFHGEYVILLEDGTELRLSRRRREALKRLLGGPE